ncbi:polysaccharide export protein EpsE [Pelomonas sp. APW6]|uniref:Polysaccharide export protein EpsE n=1 Tax=Roseateles subflavus TaxID=3053353 RepID=A0ABT7LLC7_9BURK|nr:polysaccharide export protein EpsE [Pelomonas sp. APW6]MDL5032950.1 polysaccharide export protein EpsE [Pelomonas sp. APW6]
MRRSLLRACALILATSAPAVALAQAPVPGAGTPASAASATASAPEYRLAAGDAIRINVYQNPDLTLETRVSESGSLSYPLLGSVKLGGLSLSQAEQLIADGLRNGNFVKQPTVTIVVLQVRGNQASVLGMVNRPGRYPLEMGDTRLSDLLAAAGGVALAGSDLIVLSGRRQGKPYRLEIDLPSLFATQGREQDVIVQNGDVLWVDRAPMVYIYGEVNRPGSMRLERGMTLMQLLATGGGTTQRGTQKGITVHRRLPDGKIQILRPDMDESMKEGDVVYVRESLF